MLVVTGREMAEIDRRTIEEIGIPGMVLMENAARGAAEFFLKILPDLLNRRIVILAGSGNNGGDGFVLARIFAGRGAAVEVICLSARERLKDDALANLQIIERLEIPISQWRSPGDVANRCPPAGGAIIDAILGTGLNTEVKGLFSEVIEAVNNLGIPILSVDIPSGLDSETGRPLGAAIRATATATFAFPKVGLLVEPGNEFTGTLGVIDIGIPQRVSTWSGIRRYGLDADAVAPWISSRPSTEHKGSAGHVAVLAGSRGKTGASALVCLGAGRVGAGLVTLFTPESLNSILEVKLTEAMTVPIRETEAQTPALAALPQILSSLEGASVLAIGPGISLHAETKKLAVEVIRNAECPMVIDADAITILSENLEILASRKAPTIITPHPGEMARFIHGTVKDVQEDRMGHASRFAAKHGVYVVLKGHRTIFASPDGELAINLSGNPAMASGGMGDTLTGMIAGLLAQGFPPERAACLGVYIHGAAADRRFSGVASRGLLATDILDDIPEVIGELERLGKGA